MEQITSDTMHTTLVRRVGLKTDYTDSTEIKPNDSLTGKTNDKSDKMPTNIAKLKQCHSATHHKFTDIIALQLIHLKQSAGVACRSPSSTNVYFCKLTLTEELPIYQLGAISIITWPSKV